MIDLKTVTIQLIDGKADGIRICRVEGESLVTVVVPREKLAQAKALPDLPHRGVYYLLDEDHGVLSRVYAGQTTQGLARLEAHKTKKEFWNRASCSWTMKTISTETFLTLLKLRLSTSCARTAATKRITQQARIHE